MRAPFQAGDFPAPVKYGYASVGTVERGPADLRGTARVRALPASDALRRAGARGHVLPDDVPPARAVLAANLETAINGVWDARPHVGDRVTVVGAGTVGCLVAWLAGRIAGCDVELVDVNPQRASIARALGVRFADAGVGERRRRRRDSRQRLGRRGSRSRSASPAFEATIVEMSWYGDRRCAACALGEGFHARRLTLKSSQVGARRRHAARPLGHRRRMQLALSMLADPALDVLITGESEFEALPDVMARLATAPGDTLCHRIRYPL